jgi:glycosyltransferase involved in cell wall biosynthesis
MTPTISIVLPTHNGSRYLDQAVDSVVRQTCADWELIIVDDASADDTPRMVADWASRDARIRAVCLKQNRKLPGALNEGFRVARGRYFTWTSDDNRYHERALERMLEALEADPGVAIVYARQARIDEQGAPAGERAFLPPEELACASCVGACFLYRREVHEKLGGYDEGLFCAEDYDFWLRASNHFRFAAIDETLYSYRIHRGSLTATRRQTVAVAVLRALRRWLPGANWLDERRRIEAWAAFGLRAIPAGLFEEMFEPFLLENQPQLGADAVASIYQRIVQVALKPAWLAYWSRDLSQFERYRKVLSRFSDDPQVRELLDRKVYPRWVYSLKDGFDRLAKRAR